jgi:YidC/Oxa1 family membrane protein insertase
MDTRRLMLLFVFVLSLMMLWNAWQEQQNPRPAQQEAAQSRQGAALPTSPGTSSDAAGVPRPSVNLRPENETVARPADAAPNAPPAEILDIRTDLFNARISTQGGDLVWLELNRFKAQSDDRGIVGLFKRLTSGASETLSDEARERRFVLLGPDHRYSAQAGFLLGQGLPDHNTMLTPLPGPRALAEGQDSFQVRLEAPEIEGVRATKVYTFRRGSYLVDVAWEIENGSQRELTPDAYFQLRRDGEAPAGDTFMLSTFYGAAVYTEAEKYQKVAYADVAEGKAKFAKTANNGWLAMVQHYFVAAWAPQDNTPREFSIRKEGDLYAASLIVPMQKLAPGDKGEVKVPLFAGPQEQAALKQVTPGLDLVVDYGMLHIIAAPIFWALAFINSLFGNWGWSIVVLTILIKLLFFPLSAASYKSMARMRQMTPKLMQLKERYADDKQRLNQEMMKLYQTEKINPLGGCLPILVQIPVFIALYWVLLGAVEMRDAPWILWIQDLSAADPYCVLPVIMMASMFIQTRLNPTPPDPMQARMMMMMPLIFGIMFFFFPAGLVLYWVVNNILSIAQQWWITRGMEKGNAKPRAANDPVA